MDLIDTSDLPDCSAASLVTKQRLQTCATLLRDFETHVRNYNNKRAFLDITEHELPLAVPERQCVYAESRAADLGITPGEFLKKAYTWYCDDLKVGLAYAALHEVPAQLLKDLLDDETGVRVLDTLNDCFGDRPVQQGRKKARR